QKESESSEKWLPFHFYLHSSSCSLPQCASFNSQMLVVKDLSRLDNAIRPAIKDALQLPIRSHASSSAACAARSASVSHLELTAIRRNVHAITIGRHSKEDPNVLEELDSRVASINKIRENMTVLIFSHYTAMILS
ncbi:hypothetical protein SAY86_025436, partial [Trapa natans]